jgi:phage regulator Rha-like protein
MQGKIQEAFTTSTAVSEEFSARHELVLRAITELEASND